MKIRTSKDLVPSLKGSAFRKLTLDGRSRHLSEIPTMTKLRRERKNKSA